MLQWHPRLLAVAAVLVLLVIAVVCGETGSGDYLNLYW